ncbi:MAG TPA: YqgE/AlgH family protein [Chakrabartia sp.]|nr:YqgE/AlgH family protein [Chakrabartia sp.]
MDQPRFLVGQFLLAMPGIGDPRFEHSVIAICSHDEEGALGIGIGQALPDAGLHGMLEQFDIDTQGVPDVPLYQGGPVEPQRGFVLHSDDWAGQGTIHVAGRWALSASLDVLRVLGRPAGPSRWLVAPGYAGWGPGQLDEEMLRHGWHVSDIGFDTLMDRPASGRWEAAFRATGIDPRLLSSESGHA